MFDVMALNPVFSFDPSGHLPPRQAGTPVLLPAPPVRAPSPEICRP